VEFARRQEHFEEERIRLDDRAEYDAREDGWVRRTLLPEEWVVRRKRAAMAAAAAAAAAQGCTAAAIAVVGPAIMIAAILTLHSLHSLYTHTLGGAGDHCSCYTHTALTTLTIYTH
jgi:hypothetical protein